jgi:hypothetical protein
MSCYRALDLWREIVPVVLEAETGLQIEYGVRQKVVLDLSCGEPKNPPHSKTPDPAKFILLVCFS